MLQRTAGNLLHLPIPAAAAIPVRLVAIARGPDLVLKPLPEVRYFHAEGKYTRVYLAEEEGLLNTGIAAVHAQLPPGMFLKVHRSVVVNLDRVLRVRRDDFGRMYLCLDGRTEKVPVSRTHEQLFRAGIL